VEQSLHDIFDEPDRYVNLAEVAHWQIVFNSTLAVTLFFVWIKVWLVAVLSAHCWNYWCTSMACSFISCKITEKSSVFSLI